jgi:predicted nucleotidyltransferase
MSPAARARARLREETITRLRAFLAEHPPPRAERVILFGSLARGDFDGASDADLLLVGPEDTLDRGVFDAAGRACDIHAMRPETWSDALARGHPFVTAIAREGIELWRASDASGA